MGRKKLREYSTAEKVDIEVLETMNRSFAFGVLRYSLSSYESPLAQWYLALTSVQKVTGSTPVRTQDFFSE